MINKVVISAAGKGTRMGDLTKDIPKPLLSVKGKPFLYYVLENLKRAKFSEFIVVVGYKGNKVVEFLKEYDSSIKIVNQLEVLGEKKYGTACPIMCVEDLVENENFISVNGDNLYSPLDLARFRIDDNYCYMAGLRVKDPKKYGSLIVDKDDLLVEIKEKSEKFYSDLVNINLFKFTPEIFKAVKKVGKSKRGEYEITDAVNILAQEKKVKLKIMQNYWFDFGSLEDIPAVEKFVEKEFNI
jgi:NDP-sugar pyrophosphorylase family protein